MNMIIRHSYEHIRNKNRLCSMTCGIDIIEVKNMLREIFLKN